jgi:hypothetical protein
MLRQCRLVQIVETMLRWVKIQEEVGMTSEKWVMAGACVLAVCVATAGNAQARKALKCANPAEVTAMQAAAFQQQLMDAALTCGDTARDSYNAFQTSFGPELRRSDRTLLRMFTRVLGGTKGDKAYNLFKTELAAKAELRRVHNSEDFCKAAGLVAAAALTPAKPSLHDVVSGIPIADVEGPVDSCDVQVAVTLQGSKVVPAVVPRPNPLRSSVPAPPQPAAMVGTPALAAPDPASQPGQN